MKRRRLKERRLLRVFAVFAGLTASFAALGFAWAPPARAASAAAAACGELPAALQSGCLEKLAIAADAKLNEAFRDAVRVIEKSNDDVAKWKAALKEAQRAWIAFRDADCGALTAYEWSHGTGMGAATESCLLEKTEQRARELKQRYADRP